MSPAIAAAGVDQATGQAISAPAAVALRLESSRSELQAAVLKLASSPVVLLPAPKPGAKPEGATAERFTQVRGAITEALPEALRPLVVVGVYTDLGTMMAQGPADPAAAPEGFDAKAASAAGGKGEVLEVFGAPHLIFSVPQFISEKNEVKASGFAFVGLPLVIDAQKLVEGVAKDLSLSALGLSVGGKVIAAGGARKELVDSVIKQVKPGQTVRADTGSVMALGPINLPMLTNGDVMGGQAPNEMGVRRDIPGTPFEVIAVASVRPTMEALAGYQKTSLLMFLGLFVAAIAFTLLMGSAPVEEEAYVGPRAPAPAVTMAPRTEAAPLPIADAPAPAEASPDDFNFGPSGPAAPVQDAAASNGLERSATQEAPRYHPPEPVNYNPPPVEEPAEDPFAGLGGNDPIAAPPPPQRAPAPTAAPVFSLGDDDGQEHQRTTSYPAHGYKNPMSMAQTQNNPVLDPFAMAGGLMSSDEQMQGDNPDATRVATIPQELLNASARGSTGENPMPKTLSMPRVGSIAPSVAAGGGSEEAHFQEVFRDFVATRERCGEAADGLTFEKFVAKLRKNKDQLVAKYNCKTVRFQVYVKEGKAALKATPVKE